MATLRFLSIGFATGLVLSGIHQLLLTVGFGGIIMTLLLLALLVGAVTFALRFRPEPFVGGRAAVVAVLYMASVATGAAVITSVFGLAMGYPLGAGREAFVAFVASGLVLNGAMRALYRAQRAAAR